MVQYNRRRRDYDGSYSSHSHSSQSGDKESRAVNISHSADFHALHGDYDKALRLYHEAIDLWPYNPVFWNNAALCYTLKGDYHTALYYINKAIALTLCNGSLILAQMDSIEDALSYIDIASKFAPDSKEFKFFLDAIMGE